MGIRPIAGNTTWRQFINQAKALLNESEIKEGHFGDTVMVDTLYRAMCLTLAWSPFEILEEINFSEVTIQIKDNTGTLPNDLIRLKTVLANSRNFTRVFAIPKDLDDFYATASRYPNDSLPMYAKKGFTIKVFPNDITTIDITYIKKPAKWQSSSDDNAYIELPMLLEPACLAVALYYLRQRDTGRPEGGQAHWNNFADIMAGLYILYGKTPPRLGLTPSEQAKQ